MPESRLTVANRKARLAKAALEAAATAGQPTEDARQRLADAEAEVEAAKAAEQERIQAAEAKIHTEAEVIVGELTTLVQSEQDRILALIEQPTAPSATIQHAVALVKARGEHDEAQEAVAGAKANLNQIEQRIGHLTAQR
ncbi:MAG: hypothetical protein EOM22_18585, partial [Gammaproteobacteria bacterium]|nr:hypothetical protein [Gammaproteobacteria bacterium]